MALVLCSGTIVGRSDAILFHLGFFGVVNLIWAVLTGWKGANSKVDCAISGLCSVGYRDCGSSNEVLCFLMQNRIRARSWLDELRHQTMVSDQDPPSTRLETIPLVTQEEARALKTRRMVGVVILAGLPVGIV